MTRQWKKVELIAKNDDRRDSRDDQVKKAGTSLSDNRAESQVGGHPMQVRPKHNQIQLYTGNCKVNPFNIKVQGQSEAMVISDQKL